MVKKSAYWTLLVDPKADYDMVLTKGAQLLHLVPDNYSLCHANGSKIVDDDIK